MAESERRLAAAVPTAARGGLSLAILYVLAYFLAYTYWVGFYRYFRVPRGAIDLRAGGIATVAVAIGAVAVLLTVAEAIIGLRRRIYEDRCGGHESRFGVLVALRSTLQNGKRWQCLKLGAWYVFLPGRWHVLGLCFGGVLAYVWFSVGLWESVACGVVFLVFLSLFSGLVRVLRKAYANVGRTARESSLQRDVTEEWRPLLGDFFRVGFGTPVRWLLYIVILTAIAYLMGYGGAVSHARAEKGLVVQVEDSCGVIRKADVVSVDDQRVVAVVYYPHFELWIVELAGPSTGQSTGETTALQEAESQRFVGLSEPNWKSRLGSLFGLTGWPSP